MPERVPADAHAGDGRSTFPPFVPRSNLTQANAAAAIEALQPAEPYDAGDYGVLYLRASAYLAADRPSDAAAEFQKVIDRAQ